MGEKDASGHCQVTRYSLDINYLFAYEFLGRIDLNIVKGVRVCYLNMSAFLY